MDESERQVQIEPLCVLDFYVGENCQRKGYGRRLFDFMLTMENQNPHLLAYDRPSPKLLNFVHKLYNLNDYIPQNNNFVIFKEFGLESMESDCRKRVSYSPLNGNTGKQDSRRSSGRYRHQQYPPSSRRNFRNQSSAASTIYPSTSEYTPDDSRIGSAIVNFSKRENNNNNGDLGYNLVESSTASSASSNRFCRNRCGPAVGGGENVHHQPQPTRFPPLRLNTSGMQPQNSPYGLSKAPSEVSFPPIIQQDHRSSGATGNGYGLVGGLQGEIGVSQKWTNKKSSQHSLVGT